MKENLLISRCFLGVNCKYNGKNNLIDKIEMLKNKYNLYDVCPESDGGLSTPRVPSEIQRNGLIVTKTGLDVTSEYNKGAHLALNTALKYKCSVALFKEKSPSCGVDKIYNGSFNGTLVSGQGNTTALLRKAGIKVYSENDIDELL